MLPSPLPPAHSDGIKGWGRCAVSFHFTKGSERWMSSNSAYFFSPPFLPPPPQLGTSDLGEFHAFIVVDMQDLSKVSGKEIVLLRIRNPWGRRCWKGPWREG